MAELPENLQIVKTEGPQLPETEVQPRRLIKERLNLHVKRRLQQEQEPQAQTQQQLQKITHPSGNIARETVAITAPQQSPKSANVNVNLTENDVTASTSTSKRKEKQQQKEPVKTRRPYQKRVDKNTTKIQTQTQIIEDGGKGRKTKRHKQQGTFFAAGPSGNAGVLCLSPGVEEGSAGGGDEVDGRDMYSRDKEKCPDILGMVLSGKKRSLMQNAEVQEFLAKIMTAFKN
ncbi:PREDICTED: uncharacterized protein LOC108361940 [Rhagoletis zephyria]|uniref:uncharacterized protein LOC108361940 n=1 Tax=Rhagoletis zephyria TaxID=28612 RepID=UPI0008117C40|nr:PREDICTED: uncharacterized protein LOC108361940 [Rhagoletis zephyria]